MKEILVKFFSIKFVDLVLFLFFSIFAFIYFWRNSIIQHIGILVITVGLLIWYLGLRALGQHFHIFPEPKSLVTHGIYSKIRNPIYIGSFLAFAGLSIFTMSIIVIVLTLIQIPLQLTRISAEEKRLIKKYGEKYLTYKAQTWI